MFKKRLSILTIQLIADIILIAGSFIAAELIIFDGKIDGDLLFVRIVISDLVVTAFLFVFGCNKNIWKYTNTLDVLKTFFALVVSFLILLLINLLFSQKLEISFTVVFMMVVFFLLVLARFFGKINFSVKHYFYSRSELNKRSRLKRVAVYGAGYTGQQLVERFINNPGDNYLPVVIIDDDLKKRGLNIFGVPILGGKDVLELTVKNFKIDVVVIAIQTISKKELKEIYTLCTAAGAAVKIVPRIDNADRVLSANTMEIRDVKMEELLGREAFAVDERLIDGFIKDKVVMVTGGAGSIGSELCRQSLNFKCKHLVIFDAHENSLFLLNQEFAPKYDNTKYSLVIGNVRERKKLKTVLNKFKPDIVFHAAAYKHVPMMELTPVEAVKNNVMGTQNVILECNAAGVKKLILISTDKAVNPANVMGATKRIAEILIQTNGKTSVTEMAAVRFGNVLGSNGSVIGIFLEQIRNGGPVTVTHKDMKRYFMTIPEAVSLVLQAGALAKSGEVYVLDMGEPMLIYGLAAELIKMSGLVPDKDINIEITGLRPGEKLFEELNYGGEDCDKTTHAGIFVCKLEELKSDFSTLYEQLIAAVEKEGNDLVVKKLFEITPSIYRRP
jgi:FlaA1/EpsC-like NDP-sugar epimerase